MGRGLGVSGPTDGADMSDAAATIEHFDVLIVGAGMAGINAAYTLTTQRPGTRFVVLEGKGGFGGTWRTHRYPGVRADTNFYTYAFSFKPWRGDPYAGGDQIMTYLDEVIAENDLAQHIRTNHKVLAADWSSARNCWTITAQNGETGQPAVFTAGFLWMCQGYFRHDAGYTPEWPGMADFAGRIVHPQTWPDDLDCSGKRALVIGSGATAASLVPALAETCAHVTLLQRSPTYYFTGRSVEDLIAMLRALEIDDAWIFEIARRKLSYESAQFYRRCFTDPEGVSRDLIGVARSLLGDDYDIDRHFRPNYLPWRQRLATIPDGDLFKAIAAGRVTMVTDSIERFTRDGLRLASGQDIAADIIATATGFDICILGDIAFTVDEMPLAFSDTVTYRGMMFTGVPNMVWVFGYIRAAWTLRCELVGGFVCRLLQHMQDVGTQKVTVALRPDDADMQRLPFVDPDNFSPSYLMRSMHLLPRRVDKPEWGHSQDYWADKDAFPAIDLRDPVFNYA
jgi:cation diffusion facilitator CzcD-associated flavoprotein CzcO